MQMFMGLSDSGDNLEYQKERNFKIFEDKCKPVREVIDIIIQEVGSWLVIAKEFHGISLADMVQDWKACILLNSPDLVGLEGWWQPPPPPGRCKLNFNCSSKGNSGPSGFGCVIRNSHGDIIKFIASPISFANSTKVEVMGLFWGLREVRSLKLENPLVESDSAVVVGWGLGNFNDSWIYAHLIHEIRDLVVTLNVGLSHVPRSQNGMADKLAKWGIGLSNVVRSIVLLDFPEQAFEPLVFQFFPFFPLLRALTLDFSSTTNKLASCTIISDLEPKTSSLFFSFSR